MDIPETDHGALLRPHLLAAGLTDGELRRARRRGELTALERGAYAHSKDPRLRRPEERHLLLISAARPRVATDSIFSHVSAALLHGLPVWNIALDRVHTTRPRRTSGVRTGRLYVHTARMEPEEIVTVGDVPVTSVARTVCDLARTVGFEEAVAVADAALHKHRTTPAELGAAVDRAERWPGAPAARRVAAFASAGAASAGESRSRVVMARFGVAPPVLQWKVCDARGSELGTAGFGWADRGWVGEFDGLVKYGRLLRPGQVSADVVVAEKRREDAMRTRLRGFSRWTWDQLSNFAEVAERLPH